MSDKKQDVEAYIKSIHSSVRALSGRLAEAHSLMGGDVSGLDHHLVYGSGGHDALSIRDHLEKLICDIDMAETHVSIWCRDLAGRLDRPEKTSLLSPGVEGAVS